MRTRARSHEQVASAVKDERWGDAQRALQDVQQLITTLMGEVGDKAKEKKTAPKPDKTGPGDVQGLALQGAVRPDRARWNPPRDRAEAISGLGRRAFRKYCCPGGI